jgi:hypothetical protein
MSRNVNKLPVKYYFYRRQKRVWLVTVCSHLLELGGYGGQGYCWLNTQVSYLYLKG